MANEIKKYLDSTGANHLWDRIQSKLNQKANTADLASVATTGAAADVSVAANAQLTATTVQAALVEIATKTNTLIGADANKSARVIAAEEVAELLIPENAQESLDTLQEIAAWIQDHPDEVSAINRKLTLGTHTVEGEEVQYASVKDYVEAMIASFATAIETGTTNGTIKVNNTEVAVAGLGSAAFTDSTAYDAAGAAAAVLGASTDTATTNTVYGAKAYADSLIANFQPLTNAEIDTLIGWTSET